MVKKILPIFIVLLIAIAAFLLITDDHEYTPIDVLTHETIDFCTINEIAWNAIHAYWKPDTIKAIYGEQLLRLQALPEFGGRYLLLDKKEKKQLLISIRGTAVPQNGMKNVLLSLKTDMQIALVEDSILGAYFHKGFQAQAWAIFQQIEPLLNEYQKKGYTFQTTGHSLGGAVGGILALYLDHYGYPLETIVNFGQPRFTNAAGMEKFKDFPLLRIVAEGDPVSLLPLGNVITDFQTGYRYFGAEVRLLDSIYYCHLEDSGIKLGSASTMFETQKRQSWSKHSMYHYLDELEKKLGEVEEVAYGDRMLYVE